MLAEKRRRNPDRNRRPESSKRTGAYSAKRRLPVKQQRVRDSRDKDNYTNKIMLIHGERVALLTRISLWGVFFSLIMIIAYLIIVFSINYRYGFIKIGGPGLFETVESKAFIFASSFLLFLLLVNFVVKLTKFMRFRFIITDKRLIVKDEYIVSLSMVNIAGILVRQDIIGSLFNYGNIVISTNNSSVHTFYGIPNPKAIKKAVNRFINDYAKVISEESKLRDSMIARERRR